MAQDTPKFGDFGGDKAFFALAEAAPDAIITSDFMSNVVYANPAAERILGYAPHELIGKSLYSIIPERFRAAHRHGMERFVATGQARVIGHTVELVALRPDGAEFPIELSLSTWKESDKTYFTAIMRDITDRKANELALKHETASVRLLQQVTAAANEAPTVEQAMLACLEFVCKHTGWPVGHVFYAENTNLTQQLHASNLWHPVLCDSQEALRSATQYKIIAEGVGIPGKVLELGRPIWVSELANETNLPRKQELLGAGFKSAFAFPVLTGAHVVAVMEFFHDEVQSQNDSLLNLMIPVGVQLGRVIERTRAKEKMMAAALRDPLTGLPNRNAFSEALRTAINKMQRKPEYLYAVLFIDLDRFKIINDSLGHDAGDVLLVEIARRLNETIRQSDLISRLGGDEFAVFIDDLRARTDGANALKIANKILEILQAPCRIEGEEVYTSASIGLVFGGPGYDQPEQLLRDADTAMYRAKKSGKGRVEVFDPQMREKVLIQLKLESELRRALDNKEFLLHYQPVICMSTGHITGFEALIRWNHPTRGLVSPVEFIYMAEETGLITPIGWWVLEEACRWLSQLHRNKPETSHLRINVNISAVQLGHKLVDKVRQVLDTTGLNPASLKLEITESSLEVTQNLSGQPPLEILKKLGIELLIDDFGTGYSSLARLSQLPIDALKIDQSFIKNLFYKEESIEIAKCIIALANALGIGVIAEGVETLEQVELLQKLGCDQAQGYHYSYPLNEVDAVQILDVLL